MSGSVTSGRLYLELVFEDFTKREPLLIGRVSADQPNELPGATPNAKVTNDPQSYFSRLQLPIFSQ
ncbi:hypothetical protein FHS20_003758 [Phyllobacterium endophyticum]|nr:hypothetical protein [Phyllobacterium endophyticum]